MHLTAERFDARSWPDDQLDTLFGGAFPAFITADQVAKQYIGRVREWFPELNIILTGDDQVPAATGWGVPIRWNGHVPDLPAGYTDTTKRAVEGRERAEAPDTFVICGGIVSPALAGRGLAGQLITALRDLAPAATMTGTVDDWQAWTGMAFPSSGEYVIPAGLSTLRIDREHDCGTYTEPNVWVQHR
jgi:hypothetical protein